MGWRPLLLYNGNSNCLCSCILNCLYENKISFDIYIYNFLCIICIEIHLYVLTLSIFKINNCKNKKKDTLHSLNLVIKLLNRISAVMINVFALSVVDRWFEPWSDQTKDYKIGVYWLALLGIWTMCPSGATCLCACCSSELALWKSR